VRGFGSKRKTVVSILWPANDYERLAVAPFMRLEKSGRIALLVPPGKKGGTS